MRLRDLARTRPQARTPQVPAWTLGAFRRRCITFATGAEDRLTEVIWLQSNGLTADIRIPAGRPDVYAHNALMACTPADLAGLARGEGFIARTAWDGAHMSWDSFAAFQPYDRWPEPGRLERVGNCLIEWAPSGAYVEDWRLMAGCQGLSVGLELVSETGLDGQERPRGGGLVIAGDHAIQVIGRRRPVPTGRAPALIAAAPDPAAMAGDLFDCDIAYGRKGDETWTAALSVNPFRIGAPLLHDSFAFAGEDLLRQSPGPGSGWLSRTWKIDTLLADQARPSSSEVSAEGAAWIAREAGGV